MCLRFFFLRIQLADGLHQFLLVLPDLLKKGRTSVRGMWSEKKQTTYDAAVILCDTGGRYIDFKLEFPKNKRS